MLNWLRSLFRSVTLKDGDTINFKGQAVRLAGIDAPELDQPGGKKAKEYLHWLMKQGGRLSVKITGRDKYGRSLGILIGQGVEETPINQLMVRGGHAVAYMSEAYKADEAFAKKKKLGWFGKKGFVTPSVWRKRKK